MGGKFLLGCTAGTLALAFIYFIGYQPATWNPPSPSFGVTLKTAVKFVSMSFGAGVAQFWGLASVGTFLILLPTSVLFLWSALRADEAEMGRALGLILFLSGMGILALCIGWGRAAQIPKYGIPMRYALLSVPVLFASYFVWELYGPKVFRRIFQNALFLGICVMLPLNVQGGLMWRDWYRSGMGAFEKDLRAGVPRLVLAEKHRDFLLHWDQERLASCMQMLRSAGIGPLQQIREDSDAPGVYRSMGHQ
jgi:hypothetical protein